MAQRKNKATKRKMCEMISELGAGFISVGTTLEERQNRLNAVCSAWNMACGSPERRQRQLQQYVEGYMRFNPATTPDDLAKIPWRSPVGAPVTRSSDLPHRFGQLSLGEFAVLTPTVQFPVAPRRFQRRQGQHALRRPTHPLVLATPGDRPVVELLHPRARDP
jgi:hypothetical protein